MDESELTEIALKLADGAPVDWERLKTEASDAHARLLIRFQQIEALARCGAVAQVERDQFDSIREALRPEEGPPLRWGRLEILEKVGRGSYGSVYRARDARLDRIVALKLLKDRAEAAPSDSEVINEARLLARIRHPNVVTVYGAEQHDGRTGVWMEYVEGPTLEQELREDGPFDKATVIKIGLDLCDALTAVHRAGVLHRDIKTQNVIRETGSARIVLTDFGASREQSAGNFDSQLAGTPAYLAPEVLRGSAESPQSDLYSLGVLLYRLATGSFPVPGKTLGDLRDAHDSGRIEPQPVTRVSVKLLAVIRRTIAAEPFERYQSASELESALIRVRSARRKRVHNSSPEERLMATMLVVAMLLAFAALFVWFGLRS